MSADAFIDSNVFVYQIDWRDVRKQAVAEGLIRDALASGSACIGSQVIQEWLNVAARKAEIPLDPPRRVSEAAAVHDGCHYVYI